MYVIKSLTSVLGDEILTLLPDDVEEFGFWLLADISANNISTRMFEFFVCTPKFIAKEVASKGSFFERGILVVDEFDVSSITNELELLVNTYYDENDRLGFEILERYAKSEYEGYEE